MKLLMELNVPQNIIDIGLLVIILAMGILMWIRYKQMGTNQSMKRKVSNFILARPWITIIIYTIPILFVLFMNKDHRLILPLFFFTIIIVITLYYDNKKKGNKS